MGVRRVEGLAFVAFLPHAPTAPHCLVDDGAIPVVRERTPLNGGRPVQCDEGQR